MDDPLIGTAAEGQIGIAKLSLERSIHYRVKIWKNLTQTLVCQYFFICKTSIAPYGFSCFLFDAAGKFSERLNLI